jgi:cyclase
LQEVSDGIFAYVQLDGSWCLNNTGFLVGRDGVTAIDTCATEGAPARSSKRWVE